MTPAIKSAQPAKDNLVAGYESLREQIIHGQPGGRPGQGLAILLTKGMAAWVGVCAARAVTMERAYRPQPIANNRRLAGLTGEVVSMVASLLLARCGRDLDEQRKPQ